MNTLPKFRLQLKEFQRSFLLLGFLFGVLQSLLSQDSISSYYSDLQSIRIYTSIDSAITIHSGFENLYTQKFKAHRAFFFQPLIDIKLQNKNQSIIPIKNSFGFAIGGFPTSKLEWGFNVNQIAISHANLWWDNIQNSGIQPLYHPNFQGNNKINITQIGGYLTYKPFSFLNFQIGQGSPFWGQGYRSNFLGNAVFPYPYIQANLHIWHIQYTHMISILEDYKLPLFAGWQKKYAASHILNWNITPNFNINFFESVIWDHADSAFTRGIEVNYLNPLVFLRPLEYSVGSPDNALLGIGSGVKIFKHLLWYSQILVDEFYKEYFFSKNNWWAKKFAIQTGFKGNFYNSASRISYLAEFNMARPFTYAHNNPSRVYGQKGQPLAHPLGSNFMEEVFKVEFAKERLNISVSSILAQKSRDPENENLGNNIYKNYTTFSNEFNNNMLQGIPNNLSVQKVQIAYLMIPAWNWYSFMEFSHLVSGEKSASLFKIGFRTTWSEFGSDYQ